MDARLLLNANADWLTHFDPAALDRDDPSVNQLLNDLDDVFHSHNHADGSAGAFFADPTTWDLSPLLGDLDTTALSPDQLHSLVDTFMQDDHPSGGYDSSSEWTVQMEPLMAAGGTYVLYLDFDGATVAGRPGDSWLYNYDVTVPEFDLGRFGWEGRETEATTYIAAFVQEDYAPYNLEVVTDKPASGNYTTIFVGGDNNWFQANSGVIGVATYDVGNSRASNYGFAFTDEMDIYYNYSGGSLLNFSEYVANLISHEAGHTFGANHISDTSALMNPYLPLSPLRSMFGAGTIQGSTQTQDTQQLMGANLGYRNGADDTGNSLPTAETISIGEIRNGVLERRDDIDAYRFTAATSATLQVEISTDDFANLDAYLRIQRIADGMTVAENDDTPGSLDAAAIFATEAGEEYILYVSSADGHTSGSYTLSFNGLADWTPNEQITIEDTTTGLLEIDPFGDAEWQGQLSAPADIQQHILTLDTGGSVAWQVTPDTTSPSYIALYDADGTLLDWSLSPAGETVILTQSVSPAEPTFLLVGSVNETETFSYSLLVNGPGQISQSIVPDIAGQAELVGDVTPADTDFFTFEAPDMALGGLAVGLDVSGSWDAMISLYDRQGHLLQRTNAGATAENETLFYNSLIAGEDYFLRVQATNIEDTGNYDLSLQVDLPAAKPELTVTDIDNNPDDHLVDLGEQTIDIPTIEIITLTNTGLQDVVIASIDTDAAVAIEAIDEEFVSPTNITLEPFQSLLILVTWTPDQLGAFNGTITINSNDPENPQQTVTLTGSAHEPSPELTMITTETIDTVWDMGELLRGQNNILTLTLRNDGHADLLLDSVTASAGFDILPLNDISLEPGDTVEVQVQITPEQRGPLMGELFVQANTTPDLHTLALTANVVGGVLSISDTAQTPDDGQIDFGDVMVFQNAVQTVTLTNVGEGPLLITDLSTTLGFTLDPQHLGVFDPITLDVGQSLDVNVTFAPQDLSMTNGVFTIATDDPDHASADVNLAGQPLGGLLEISEVDGVSDQQADFGPVTVDQEHHLDVWQLTNHGNIPVTITLAIQPTNGFDLNTASTLTIAAGAVQDISTTFLSHLALEHETTLTLQADDIYETQGQITLAADAYALVQQGLNYRFDDHSGDRVILRLNGSGTAIVRLGEIGEPDIRQILLSDTTDTDTLRIQTRGRGHTQLAELSSDDDLKAIQASNVDVVNSGIDINGTVSRLQLGHLVGGADVQFQADKPVNMRVGQITGDSRIIVDGPIKSFRSEHFLGGSLQTDALDKALIQGRFAGDIAAEEGSIGKVIVRKGDLQGGITAGQHIGQVNVMQGSLTGVLNADSIDKILVQRMQNATVQVQRDIQILRVREDMLDSNVIIGSSAASGLDANGGANAAESLDTRLGSLKVGGTFGATTIAVGVAPDEFGSYLAGSATAATGRIGQAKLTEVQTDNNHEMFGLIARDQIDKLIVQNRKLADPYQKEDFVATSLDA